MLLVNVSIQDMYRPAEQVPLRGIGSVLGEKDRDKNIIPKCEWQTIKD